MSSVAVTIGESVWIRKSCQLPFQRASKASMRTSSKLGSHHSTSAKVLVSVANSGVDDVDDWTWQREISFAFEDE